MYSPLHSILYGTESKNDDGGKKAMETCEGKRKHLARDVSIRASNVGEKNAKQGEFHLPPIPKWIPF